MSQVMSSWQRYIDRPKYNGPDAITIEGEKFQFGGSKMPVVREMLAEHLNSVIRGLNNGEVGRAKSIRSATFAALKRLGAKRDLRRAVRKVPKGSDQFDVGSIVVWLSRIGKDDAKAIDQVIVIDATATVRVKG